MTTKYRPESPATIQRKTGRDKMMHICCPIVSASLSQSSKSSIMASESTRSDVAPPLSSFESPLSVEITVMSVARSDEEPSDASRFELEPSPAPAASFAALSAAFASFFFCFSIAASFFLDSSAAISSSMELRCSFRAWSIRRASLPPSTLK